MRRPEYSKEFRSEVVDYVKSNPNISYSDAERMFGVKRKTITHWVYLSKNDHKTPLNKHGVELKGDRKKRECLKCHKMFMSQHVGIRLCDECKSRLHLAFQPAVRLVS